MARYQFSDGTTILAEQGYMDEHYPSGNYTLVPEPEVPVVEPPKYLTRLAFRSRFTPAEKIALYTAAETTVAIRVYLDDVNAATFIDPTRPDTIGGVQALEGAGVIGAGRANAILTAPITADEEWRGL